jgi:anaerobic magnesium-protoporphyrin IX monomethyl ester cyclase
VVKASTGTRVLLCLPKWQGRNHSIFLGVASLAASLHKAGSDVAVYDDDVASFAAEREACSSEGLLEQVISQYSPTIIGIHINTPNYEEALNLAQRISALTDVPIVAGGPHATVASAILLSRHAQINYVLQGEADYTLPVLAERLSSGEKIEGIPGLSFRADKEVCLIPQESRIGIDGLPVPCREALLSPPFPVLAKWASYRYQENFYSSIAAFGGRRATNAYASRGCVRACRFCFPGSFWWDKKRGFACRQIRPVSNLIEELTQLRQHGYGAVYFDEAAFPFDQKSWLAALVDEMADLDLRWGGAALFDQVVKAPLGWLAKRGLRYLYFGFESPIAGLQERIGKRTRPEDALDFLACCRDHGIQCDLSLFFGIPGETEQSIMKTIEWLDKNLPSGNAFFSIAAIWPGTPWAKKEGLTPQCWEPDFNKSTAPENVVWYAHDLSSIGNFFANSLGTYHPAFMTPERALWIKEAIIASGFRARFSTHSRNRMQA